MLRIAIALAAFAVASPAVANVHEASDAGFVVRQAIDVPVVPDVAWPMLLSPAKWWSKEHSYSGDPTSFSLDARAGGCFCEVLRSEVSRNAAPRGSVEHFRVVYVEQPRALRMTGALGPLQSSAATGTLTIMLRPIDGGTRILWEYAVGGYMRADPRTVAANVDRVLAEQVQRLGQQLGASRAPVGASALQPARRDPGSDAVADEFEREMAAGLAEAEAREKPAASPPPRSSELPARNTEQPVFIGR